MRVHSFIEQNKKLIEIEVELTLWPGLPGIYFVGMPDRQILESAVRIKSAIKSQGFDFPTTKKVLVNLRPNYIKKSSPGLELAVAAAFLLETKQIENDLIDLDPIYFGELDLSGRVYSPPEKIFSSPAKHSLVTGRGNVENFCCSQATQIQSLGDLKSKLTFRKKNILKALPLSVPEELKNMTFSDEIAFLLKLCALGQHSVLLAGMAGAGKSAFAKIVYYLRSPPSEAELGEIMEIHPGLRWRPLIQPHHTTPKISFIGGSGVGGRINHGEITRAHNGVLILDEFLEFDADVIEALREPMETKKIRISRGGVSEELPADCQILATTNLCPCGKWTPENTHEINCAYSERRCRSICNRISGPLLDRFEALIFFNKLKRGSHSYSEIACTVLEVAKFRQNRITKSQKARNGPQKLDFLLPESNFSFRRRSATHSIARTIADIENEDEVNTDHIERALKITYHPFLKLVP